MDIIDAPNYLNKDPAHPHRVFADMIRADPAGIGSQKARLYNVHYGRPYYRYEHHAAPQGCYEFNWPFHRECGKDRCLSADHEMTLKALVDAMDADDE